MKTEKHVALAVDEAEKCASDIAREIVDVWRKKFGLSFSEEFFEVPISQALREAFSNGFDKASKEWTKL